jgi:ketosteroid isomerase-like protein
METVMVRLSRFAVLIGAMLVAKGAPPVNAAADDASQTEIRSALTQWTADFNAARADKVCALFAPDLRADVHGQPERDYGALCELLQRSLGDRTKRYAYALDIKEILVWGDIATVRLVWTLTVQPNDAPAATSVEPGMDIFRREGDGSWKITRFMSYER